MRRSFLVAALAVLAVILAAGCISVADARPVALSSTTRLTHAPSYVAPTPPEDVAAFVQQQQQRLQQQQQQQQSHSSSSLDSLDSSADLTQLAHCSDCQLFIQVAEWAVASNSTMTLLEALADSLCSKYAPTSATCPKLVADLIALGEKIPAVMKHLGLYEPLRVCSFLGVCSVSCCSDATSPQQIALSVGSNCSEMHVSWVTGGNATESVVQFGLQGQLNNRASGYSLSYTQGGWMGTIHRVVLSGLQPGSVYSYSVGGVGATSAQFTFTTWDDSNVATPFRIGVVGDMAAAESDYATKNIAYLNQQQGLQAIIHIGDISYADGYMATWDEFFQSLQPAMTRIPYQVIPGNHELLFNFTAYKSRFFQPGLGSAPAPGLEAWAEQGVFSDERVEAPAELAELESSLSAFQSTPSGTNLYSSWDLGCVHFIGLCSEDNFNTAFISDAQIAWLEQDLAATGARIQAGAKKMQAAGLSQPETCSIDTPTFIVVYMHRPLYCTDGSDECAGLMAEYLRSRVESIFQKAQVDLVLYGHMHNFERTYPIFNNQRDPSGPVYIVNGAGGNREGVEDDWTAAVPAWSAFRGSVAGVGEITLVNATTLQWQFFAQRNDTSGQVDLIDQVFLQARPRGSEKQMDWSVDQPTADNVAQE